jgi:predicted transcriptional regulator
VMTQGIHCCREDDDLIKAVRHMETLEIRRLPVIGAASVDLRNCSLCRYLFG